MTGEGVTASFAAAAVPPPFLYIRANFANFHFPALFQLMIFPRCLRRRAASSPFSFSLLSLSFSYLMGVGLRTDRLIGGRIEWSPYGDA